VVAELTNCAVVRETDDSRRSSFDSTTHSTRSQRGAVKFRRRGNCSFSNVENSERLYKTSQARDRVFKASLPESTRPYPTGENWEEAHQRRDGIAEPRPRRRLPWMQLVGRNIVGERHVCPKKPPRSLREMPSPNSSVLRDETIPDVIPSMGS